MVDTHWLDVSLAAADEGARAQGQNFFPPSPFQPLVLTPEIPPPAVSDIQNRRISLLRSHVSRTLGILLVEVNLLASD